jgi:hypothetical protein
MCGRLGGVEDRVGQPDVAHVVAPKPGVLEEVGSLFVDLEGVVSVQQVDVEQVGHRLQV